MTANDQTATAQATGAGPRYLRVKDACRQTSIPRSALYASMDAGELPYFRVGKRGRRIAQADLDAYMQARRVARPAN